MECYFIIKKIKQGRERKKYVSFAIDIFLYVIEPRNILGNQLKVY
jgi:hypothetical protein